jgi:hypothetical protein
MPPIIGVGGIPGAPGVNTVPQLRQNFMPGGFSARQAGQVAGNPAPAPGVCPAKPAAPASWLPQLRQNIEPGGLS